MPFLLHCRQFAFLKGIWEPWHHQNEGLLVAFLPFLFIFNCGLLFQSSFLFPAWTLALDCTRMLIFQLQWLFQFFWLSSPLGLTHPPVAGVPWQLILHFSPKNERPRGQEGAAGVNVDGAWAGTWKERAACGLISLFRFFLFYLAST